MKQLIGVVLMVVLAAGAVLCLAPSVGKGQTAQQQGGLSQDATQAAAEYQKQMDDYVKRVKRSDDMLKAQEEAQRRAESLMARQEESLKRGDVLAAKQEEMLKKQEAQLARYDKILQTWEAQQKQYQKYLDGLK